MPQFTHALRPAAYFLLAHALTGTLAHAQTVGGAGERLRALKARVMDADYRADLAALASLPAELAPLAEHPALGYLASYWSGFASWRAAINGTSHAMPREELRANLVRAAAEFDRSLAARPDFADAWAAGGSVNGWMASFFTEDLDSLRELVRKARRYVARAKELEPDNPRVLWVEAVPYLVLPPERGGDPARGLALYRRMAEVATLPAEGSPLPDWGKPEGHMSVAYVLSTQASPELDEAEREAREALRLQPDWSYVRDVLLPQIEARQREARSGAAN